MPGLPHLDAHCHPNHPGGAPQFPDSVIFANAVEPAEWVEQRSSAGEHAIWGIGLHPLWLKSNDQVDAFFKLLPEADAVGEVGLDYTGHAPLERAEQREILARVLAHPETKKRPVSLHALLAYEDVVEMVIEHEVPGAILHWYADANSLPRAIEGDIFFSVNDAIFADPEQAAVVGEMPRNRILTETDGPYILKGGAVGYGPWLPFVDPTRDYDVDDSLRLRAGQVDDTERSLAELWGVSVEEVHTIIWQNLAELEARVEKRPFGAAERLAATTA